MLALFAGFVGAGLGINPVDTPIIYQQNPPLPTHNPVKP